MEPSIEEVKQAGEEMFLAAGEVLGKLDSGDLASTEFGHAVEWLILATRRWGNLLPREE